MSIISQNIQPVVLGGIKEYKRNLALQEPITQTNIYIYIFLSQISQLSFHSQRKYSLHYTHAKSNEPSFPTRTELLQKTSYWVVEMAMADLVSQRLSVIGGACHWSLPCDN